MKKNSLINKIFFTIALAVMVTACGDDDEDGDKASAGFAGIASSYYEGDGDVTMTIPFVHGSVSSSDIVIDGTATEGEDYELVGITAEGVEIKFLDDTDCESTETLRLTIVNTAGVENRIHTVTLFSSNLSVGIDIADWLGAYGGDDIIFTSGALAGWSGEADVTLAGGGTHTIDGLGVDFIQTQWGETVTASDPVVFTVTSGGVITIAEQYLFTTDYEGDPYDYNVVGTGQINKCDGTITLNYDIVYSDHSLSLGNYFKSYQSGRVLFTSVIVPQE